MTGVFHENPRTLSLEFVFYNMRIILIRASTSDPSVEKLCKTLSKNGHKVKLLAWDRGNVKNFKECNLYTLHSFRFKAPYGKLTVLFYLPIWWIYVTIFLMKEDVDVIHACDFDTLLPAVFSKLIKKAKFCYTIYDFYADNVPTIIPRFIRRGIAYMEKALIRYTDILFLVDESRYEQIRGSKVRKLVYIYNSPSDYFDSKRKSMAMQKEIVLFYAGYLAKSRGLEYMIKAIMNMDDVKLLLAGTGPDKESILKLASVKPGIVNYLGWLSYEEVIKWSLSSHILFAFYDTQIPNNKYASPNKLFEAMMCGKPIIVNDGTAMSRIVRRENCGLVVPYGNIGSIRKAIVKLRDDPKLYRTLGKNGRKAYEKCYSWEMMENRLMTAYEKLSNV